MNDGASLVLIAPRRGEGLVSESEASKQYINKQQTTHALLLPRMHAARRPATQRVVPTYARQPVTTRSSQPQAAAYLNIVIHDKGGCACYSSCF